MKKIDLSNYTFREEPANEVTFANVGSKNRQSNGGSNTNLSNNTSKHLNPPKIIFDFMLTFLL